MFHVCSRCVTLLSFKSTPPTRGKKINKASCGQLGSLFFIFTFFFTFWLRQTALSIQAHPARWQIGRSHWRWLFFLYFLSVSLFFSFYSFSARLCDYVRLKPSTAPPHSLSPLSEHEAQWSQWVSESDERPITVRLPDFSADRSPRDANLPFMHPSAPIYVHSQLLAWYSAYSQWKEPKTQWRVQKSVLAL